MRKTTEQAEQQKRIGLKWQMVDVWLGEEKPNEWPTQCLYKYKFFQDVF